MAHFYTTLPSNLGAEYFPENTTTNFTTKLNTPINIDSSRWEVALVDVTIPLSFIAISTPQAVLYEKSVTVGRVDLLSISESYIIPPGNYASGYEMLRVLRRQMPEPIRQGLFFDMPKDKNIFIVRLSFSDGNSHSIKFVGKELCDSLGIEVGQRFTSEINEVFTIEKAEDSIVRLSPIFIYSDVAETHRVGHQSVSLLRVVPASGLPQSVINKKFTSPFYFPVTRDYIETIEIDLRSSTGEKIPFQSGVVIVVLHFRQRRAIHFKL